MLDDVHFPVLVLGKEFSHLLDCFEVLGDWLDDRRAFIVGRNLMDVLNNRDRVFNNVWAELSEHFRSDRRPRRFESDILER
jgi:hypothetical protein